jgi:hypothetical protein
VGLIGPFLIFLFLPITVFASPYEMEGGVDVRVMVMTDVVDLEVDAVEVDECDYDTNEACRNIITIYPDKSNKGSEK